MTKSKERMTKAKPAAARPRAPQLPPTISRTALMVDGTDMLVRRITHQHFVLSGLLETVRSGFASLIGLSSFQYVLMQAVGRLSDQQQWTVRSIAREMHMTDAYASVEIADLVEKGYLAKIVNPDDRRVSFLELTDKGVASLSAIAPIQQMVNDALYGHLDSNSALTYSNELSVLISRAESAISVLNEVAADQREAALRQTSKRRRRPAR
ncbi:MarR family winged helix-turn-helix transcriptional regulator [Bradyrhizobium sp. CCGB01]|uniref:MarR family winged helix-turn-helix transcriptional regulator n=1 Tax=Bradyrhizobium sp. CCGB01 TaxID=2949634 RepID=UPI0020B2F288|nr:MarR family winged helix-turn-helix transcriptional regulator [Bradyrhizobium sp. CCGB01]MCP3407595.1 MarR family winged helix-turn-helix transcriptional regulator [Bradyrhizobium sp. CCGB01]